MQSKLSHETSWAKCVRKKYMHRSNRVTRHLKGKKQNKAKNIFLLRNSTVSIIKKNTIEKSAPSLPFTQHPSQHTHTGYLCGFLHSIKKQILSYSVFDLTIVHIILNSTQR